MKSMGATVNIVASQIVIKASNTPLTSTHAVVDVVTPDGIHRCFALRIYKAELIIHQLGLFQMTYTTTFKHKPVAIFGAFKLTDAC